MAAGRPSRDGVSTMRIDEIYRTLWQYRYAIALLTAALVAGAWALTDRQQPTYRTTTLVRVQQQVDNPGQAFTALATGEKLAQTYAEIAGTRTIAERISRLLGRSVPLSDIRGHIKATAVENLDLLRIEVSGTSPAQVQRIANAAPTALKAYIGETGTLNDRVTVAEQAALPTSPAAPSMRKNLLLALVLGLILNCGLALAARLLRDPVGSVEEIERATGLPVLATIPRLRFARGPAEARPLEPRLSSSPAGEAHRG